MIIKRTDIIIDRRVWRSGFLGYKNGVTGRLSGVNWEELVKGIKPRDKSATGKSTSK